MKFKNIALACVFSLAALFAAAGIAGAANGNALNKTPQLRDAQTGQPTVCNSQADCPKRGFEFKGLNVLSSAADLLGLQRQELKAELQAGKSLKDIAAAKGIDSAKFAKDLESALTVKIDKKVQDGKINSEQAAALKTKLSKQIQNDLDKKWDQWKGHGCRDAKVDQSDSRTSSKPARHRCRNFAKRIAKRQIPGRYCPSQRNFQRNTGSKNSGSNHN